MEQTWYIVTNDQKVTFPIKPFVINIGDIRLAKVTIKEVTFEQACDEQQAVTLHICGKDNALVDLKNIIDVYVHERPMRVYDHGVYLGLDNSILSVMDKIVGFIFQNMDYVFGNVTTT